MQLSFLAKSQNALVLKVKKKQTLEIVPLVKEKL